jgi:hypothetical protein
MSGTCISRKKKERNVRLGDTVVDGKIILKWVLNNWIVDHDSIQWQVFVNTVINHRVT